MEFIENYNLTGLLIGICTFLIIGLFHPVVIKCEYYFGTRCWWVFLILGVIGVGGALWISQIFWSSLLGVFAFSSFWTILEIFEQRDPGKKRVVSDESETKGRIQYKRVKIRMDYGRGNRKIE